MIVHFSDCTPRVSTALEVDEADASTFLGSWIAQYLDFLNFPETLKELAKVLLLVADWHVRNV